MRTGQRGAGLALGATQKTYQAWMSMHQRCYSTKRHNYSHYGGRGIRVCNRWHRDNPNGFVNFFADMGNGEVGLSLDRIDVNGPYAPENCRWSTALVQTQTRRKYGALETYSAELLAARVSNLPIDEIVMIFSEVLRKPK